MNRYPKVRRYGIIYGIVIAIAYILYFLIMRMIGQAQNITLHYVNFIILLIGLFVASSAMNKGTRGEQGFLPTFFGSIIIVLISSILFGLFMMLYTGMIDPDFINLIKTNTPLNQDIITPAVVAILVMGETIPIGVVFSLAMGLYNQQYGSSIDNAKQTAIDQDQDQINHPTN